MKLVSNEQASSTSSTAIDSMDKITQLRKKWEIASSNVPSQSDIDSEQDRYGKALSSSIGFQIIKPFKKVDQIVTRNTQQKTDGFIKSNYLAPSNKSLTSDAPVELTNHMYPNPRNFFTETKPIHTSLNVPFSIDSRLYHSTKPTDIHNLNYIKPYNTESISTEEFNVPSVETYAQSLNCDKLKFDVRRLEKLLAVNKSELQKKNATITELQTEIENLSNFKKAVELEQQSDRMISESRLTTKIAFKTAEIERLREENEILQNRLSTMDELLRQKDTELLSLQQQAAEREKELSKVSRELQAIKFEVTTRDSSLLSLEAQLISKDDYYKNQFRTLDENLKQQIRELGVQYEYELSRMYDVMQELQEKNVAVEKRFEESCKRIMNCELLVKKTEEDKKHLQDKIIDLESELATATSQNVDIQEQLVREKNYKNTIDKLNSALRNMQDKVEFLQSMSEQKSYMQRQENELKEMNTQQYDANMSTHMLSTSSSFPKPIGFRQVLIDPIKSPASKQIMTKKGHDWSNVDKWKIKLSNDFLI